MANAGDAHLDTGAQMEKQGRGRPRDSKNKPKDTSLVASLGSKTSPRYLLMLL
jgi:hypothetical protein